MGLELRPSIWSLDLAQIARKFTCLTKIEIEMLKKNWLIFARIERRSKCSRSKFLLLGLNSTELLTDYQTRADFSIKTPLFLSFAESHWVDSVISALAKILLMSSFTTFISIVVKKYFYFLKRLKKPKLEIFFDYNYNESCKGGHEQKFGKSWNYWVNSVALSIKTKSTTFQWEISPS